MNYEEKLLALAEKSGLIDPSDEDPCDAPEDDEGWWIIDRIHRGLPIRGMVIA